MKEIRKISKKIKRYQRMLKNNEEEAKRKKEYYIMDIQKMEKRLEELLYNCREDYLKMCKTSTEIYREPLKSSYTKVQLAVKNIITKGKLYKYNISITRIGILQNELTNAQLKLFRY